jgi:hypothetical protein
MTEQIIPRDFYVYAHAKATTGEIFYIGKGGPRQRREKSIHSRNGFWNRTAKKHGFKVIVVRDGLQEWAAFELEREMIALHGRRDLGLGPLVNLTDGGEGTCGAITPDHVRKIQSETASRLNADPEFKEVSRERTRARMAKPEEKAKVKARIDKLNSDPMAKAAARARMNAMHADPEFRVAHALRMKARQANPEFKAADIARKKARMSDPEFRKKVNQASVDATSKKVVCAETGEVFSSISNAARWVESIRQLGVSAGLICSVCKGNRKSAYGYTWAYA